MRAHLSPLANFYPTFASTYHVFFQIFDPLAEAFSIRLIVTKVFLSFPLYFFSATVWYFLSPDVLKIVTKSKEIFPDFSSVGVELALTVYAF